MFIIFSYMKKIIIALSITLASCSPKVTTQMWMDNKGNSVPVTVTQNGDTTVYDFGVMIFEPDTMVIDTLK